MSTAPSRLHLRHHELTRLTRARDARLDVIRGVAWITLDGDPRDIVLEAGQSFVVDSGRPLIVFALEGPAAVDVRPQPETARRASRSWTSGWLRAAGAA